MEADTLEKVEGFAKLFFSPEEITIILGVDSKEKMKDDFKRSYQKGRLLSIADVRKSVLELAKSGSSPAQVLALKFIDDSKLDHIE